MFLFLQAAQGKSIYLQINLPADQAKNLISLSLKNTNGKLKTFDFLKECNEFLYSHKRRGFDSF